MCFPTRRGGSATTATKHSLIRGGLGWGGLPASLIRNDLRSGALVHLDLPSFEQGEYPICHGTDRQPAGRRQQLDDRCVSVRLRAVSWARRLYGSTGPSCRRPSCRLPPSKRTRVLASSHSALNGQPSKSSHLEYQPELREAFGAVACFLDLDAFHVSPGTVLPSGCSGRPAVVPESGLSSSCRRPTD